MMLSSLSTSLKSASRLTRFAATVRGIERFPAAATTARRFAASSSSPSSESGSNDGGVSSTGEESTPSSNTVLFPWRHESSPLPRLIPGTPEHVSQGLLLTSQSQRLHSNSILNSIATAYMFLNVPWYELFFISSYQDELASNIGWSFTQGVASLLSNLPLPGGGDPIPMHRILAATGDDGDADGIDFCETIEISRNAENGAFRVQLVKDDATSEPSSTGSATHTSNAPIPLRKMFHEKAVELYTSSVQQQQVGNPDNTQENNHSSHEETRRFELRLKMIPYDFEFVTLYAIPYLSRRNAKSDPDLLSFYDQMLNESSTGRAPYLSKLRHDHLETNGYMESTIIAQCLVWCDELFYVKDLSTGAILQGNENKDDEPLQKTPHLVRMERIVVTKRDPTTRNFDNEQEHWIITDVDDLLEGNLLI